PHTSSLFLMRRRPPISPPFPYTTLFRSIFPLIERIRSEHRKHVIAHELLTQILDEDILWFDPEQQRLLARGTKLFALAEISGEGDRKSTRLNSSHVAISYAVFCLKKKTN